MAKKNEATAEQIAEQNTVIAEQPESEQVTEVTNDGNADGTNEATAEQKDGENLDSVEVPEDAEEITENEALRLASEEVVRLREENAKIIAELDEANAKIQAAEDIIKQFEENQNNIPADASANGYYIELLNSFEAKIDEYAGLRRERLRKEFITDLKEEIQRQREQLTNA